LLSSARENDWFHGHQKLFLLHLKPKPEEQPLHERMPYHMEPQIVHVELHDLAQLDLLNPSTTKVYFLVLLKCVHGFRLAPHAAVRKAINL
jgi:hypothetical protein